MWGISEREFTAPGFQYLVESRFHQGTQVNIGANILAEALAIKGI